MALRQVAFFFFKKAKCSHNKSETDIQKHTAVCSMSQRRYSGRCMLHKYTQRDV